MKTVFDKAGIEDYDELIDFINFVFSNAHAPHDFLILLPKLYKREYFPKGSHYIAREDGKIKALVGAYPLALEILNEKNDIVSLPGRGIGAVSVHPYFRSRGYMKILMHTALEEMKRDGMVFSFLYGQRQRYEYFGYAPTGGAVSFNCTETNISHTLGRQWQTGLSLKKVQAEDTVLLDQIQMLHEAKNLRLHRSRDRIFDILSSWKAEIYSIVEAGGFAGYFIHKIDNWNNSSCISEIQLYDLSLLPEVLGLFFRCKKHLGQRDSVNVFAGLHERKKISVLSGFSESYVQIPVCRFSVFDYPRLTDVLLQSKAASEKIKEGAFILQINDSDSSAKIRLFSDNTGVGAHETDEKPTLTLNSLDAVRFLFCPLEASSNPVIRENAFLSDALPLPLYIENADGV